MSFLDDMLGGPTAPSVVSGSLSSPAKDDYHNGVSGNDDIDDILDLVSGGSSASKSRGGGAAVRGGTTTTTTTKASSSENDPTQTTPVRNDGGRGGVLGFGGTNSRDRNDNGNHNNNFPPGLVPSPLPVQSRVSGRNANTMHRHNSKSPMRPSMGQQSTPPSPHMFLGRPNNNNNNNNHTSTAPLKTNDSSSGMFGSGGMTGPLGSRRSHPRDDGDHHKRNNTGQGEDGVPPIPIFETIVNAKDTNGNDDDDTISQITTSVASNSLYDSNFGGGGGGSDSRNGGSGVYPWLRGNNNNNNNNSNNNNNNNNNGHSRLPNRQSSKGDTSYADTLDEIADMLYTPGSSGGKNNNNNHAMMGRTPVSGMTPNGGGNILGRSNGRIHRQRSNSSDDLLGGTDSILGPSPTSRRDNNGVHHRDVDNATKTNGIFRSTSSPSREDLFRSDRSGGSNGGMLPMQGGSHHSKSNNGSTGSLGGSGGGGDHHVVSNNKYNADEIYRTTKQSRGQWTSRRSILEPLLAQLRFLLRYWTSLILPRAWRQATKHKKSSTKRGGGHLSDDEESADVFGKLMRNNNNNNGPPASRHHSYNRGGNHHNTHRSNNNNSKSPNYVLRLLGLFVLLTGIIFVMRLIMLHPAKFRSFTRGGITSRRHNNRRKNHSAHNGMSVQTADTRGHMSIREGTEVHGGMAHHSMDEIRDGPVDQIDTPKVAGGGGFQHDLHMGVQLPEAFENLADVDDLPVRKGVDIPFFWHIPRTGGGTVGDIFGACMGLTLASDVGGTATEAKENVSVGSLQCGRVQTRTWGVNMCCGHLSLEPLSHLLTPTRP